MGALTTVAGLIEVVTSFTHENIDLTIEDGKKIVNIIKDGENPRVKRITDEELEQPEE